VPSTPDPATTRIHANYGAAGTFLGPVSIAGRPPVTWPHRVGVVPLLADCRQQRPADRDLDAATGSGGAVVVCQVLSGMGGVGKTQLAAGLAHRVWERREVDLLVWVSATSRAGVVTGYAQAAADVTGIDDPDPDQAATRFLAWLASTGRRWLVVLDDLTDPTDLRGLWPPASRSGRTVITTRRRDAALTAGRRVVQVGLFTPAEAAHYLRDKLGGDAGRLDQANQLGDDLGHLPLALAQAAAYILDRGLTCAGYRRRLADQRRRLPEVVPEPDALPDEHRDTIAAAWSLSIDLADRLTPAGLARPVLELAALLDPNTIPVDLFTTDTTLTYLTGRRDTDRPVDADDAIDALHCLHRLNLITLDQTNNAVRVHGLVQRAVREATPTEHAAALAVTAADALVEIWPDIERDPRIGQILRANTAALNSHPGPLLWDADTGGHRVLFIAGRSLGGTGLVTAAVGYFHTLHTTAEHHLGPDHPDTLATRNNLAQSRGEAGDPAGAATAFEELLTDYLRVLGPHHPDTLTTRSNLAFWRGEAGDPAGAATAFEELLTDRLRVLGPGHPDTLNTRHHLAYWRGEAGDPAGAATAFEELLTDRLRVLGPDHPDTLNTRNNIAHWRGEAGDPDPGGAATAFEKLLTDQLRVLGPDHPDTLNTRGSLAYWRGEAGNPAGAATAFEELLTDWLRVLGPDHPDTLTARGNLARWRGEAGNPAGAATAFEELLTDRLRLLGPDHPDTLTTRHNLAYWQSQQKAASGEDATSA
jgi:hypothetical protein